MKKFFGFSTVIIAMLAIVVSSCSVSDSFSNSKVQAPKFTSVDRLLQVQPGMTYESVVQLLGCEPYNLLSNQLDGYSVYVYKYKLVDRELEVENQNTLNQRGTETAGMDVYVNKLEEVVLFFKDKKLELLVTNQGKAESAQMIMLGNTLYSMTQNRGQFVFENSSILPPKPETNEKPASGGFATPGLKK